jgi:hypothetical protein
MGTSYNPQIVTSGLMLAIDAANPKSYSYAENLLPFSQDITAANGWGFGPNTTFISSSNTAPNGSNTATAAFGNGSGANIFINRQVNYEANTWYTASCWAKLANGTTPTGGSILTISYSTNVLGTQTRSVVGYNGNLTSSWQRFSTTYFNVAPGLYSAFFIADQNNTATIEIWGAQVEQGNSLNKYTPTTSTAIVSSNVWSDLSGTKSNIRFTKRSPYNSNSSGYFYFNPSANTDNALTITPTLIANTSNGFSIGMWLHQSFIQHNSTWNYFLVDYPYETGTFGLTGPNFVLKDNDVVGLNSVTSQTISGGWSYIVYGTDNNLLPYIYTCNQSGITFTKNNVAFTPKILNISKLFEGYDNTYSFAANCAIVQIYNRAISNTEVQQNFNAIRGRFGV